MALPRLSIASSVLTLLASSVLLAGCMGEDDNNTPSANPSSQTPGTTETRSYVTAVRSTSTPGVGDAEDTVTSVLSLVDDTTGTEITAVPVDALTTAKVAQAFTVSVDGQSYVAGRQTKAYYVYQHKLYEIALEHDGNVLSKPTARQVSSESNACEVRQVVETDTSGQTSFINYTTGGRDGKCDTPDDNERWSTLSSADTTLAGNSDFLAVQRDSTGKVARLLGVNADNRLVIADATTAQITEVANGSIPVNSSVAVFAQVAGTTSKIYLRMGADVRLLDWNAATLGTKPVATLNLDQVPLVHTDTTDTYFLDAAQAALPSDAPSSPSGVELVLWRLKPGQSSAERVAGLGASTPEQLPQVMAHAMTPSSLAMVVHRDSGDTLTIIKKDGSKRNIALTGPTSSIGIQAQAGEVLVISQQLNTGEDASALSRLDLSKSDSLSSLSASASLVTVINDTTTTIGGEVPSSYLLWNESGTVRSHKLSGNTTLTIANRSTLAGWNGTTLSASVSNLTVGLLRGLTTATPNAETLWLFNAAKAAGAN
ncbi:MAG: hypothetical protein HYX44_06535 [Aquabacterium sp.]|nr:hypothetical protein [Aquabacterium sp.]